jgi:hypothetical protein
MLSVERGACHSIFVYDIAFAIDLNHAERLITSAIRDSIRHKRRAPQYFEYTPAPLRITQGIEPVQIESFATEPQVQLVVYDFGAVSVFYRIQLRGDAGWKFWNGSSFFYLSFRSFFHSCPKGLIKGIS